MKNIIDNPFGNDIEIAAVEYIKRKEGKSKPKYWQNKKTGLCYLARKERCKCCKGITLPSKLYPHSEINHGRTAKHVANLFGVDTTELLNKVQELKKAA